ncbi:MAG TPA: penicillin-binding protein [Pyrinomonadaceae bacterium]|nr:penicillin-binding protein [Pyrinomonadaceae bacterium]
MVAVFLCAWMVLIGARLTYLQTFGHEWLRERAAKQQSGFEAASAPRGLILDRRGRELARSVDVDSFFADPSKVESPDEAAAALSRALGTDEGALAARLREAKERGQPFVWLARRVSDEQSRAVRALDIKGVHSMQEPKRRYPAGPLAAHVVGFAGVDGGLAGVEWAYDSTLKGESQKIFFDADARRRAFESRGEGPRPGRTVVLTIDQNVQYLVEQTLSAAVERARAKSGAAIVLDPRTGEILALANAPAFDPNDASSATPESRRNDALQNIYEPGSTFKVVAYAGALEDKRTRPDEPIDCLGGGITVAGRFIRDHTPYGTLTTTEALAKSSNVAAIKLGIRLGNERMYEYMRRFGFGAKTGVELPGETQGLLRQVKNWHGSSIGSLAIGQEIGVTPVQMAAAYAAIANDGVRVAPHIVKEIRDHEGNVVELARPASERVVSAETAQTLRRMLEMVTLKGTAKRAQLEGYTAAGKTGTAQKIDPKTRGYSKTKHVASFVGFAPVERPAAVIIVVVDEPVGAYHGGDVAAPVFREIADQILPYLEVGPDQSPSEEAAPAGQLAASPQPRATAPAVEEGAAVVAVSLPEVVLRGGDGEVVYAAAGESALLMPDLRGRSVRDAALVCERLGLDLEAVGEGRAVRQSPSAGETVEAGQTVRIEFGRSD